MSGHPRRGRRPGQRNDTDCCRIWFADAIRLTDSNGHGGRDRHANIDRDSHGIFDPHSVDSDAIDHPIVTTIDRRWGWWIVAAFRRLVRDTDADRNTDAEAYRNAHAITDADAHAITDADAHRNADPNTYRNADTHAYPGTGIYLWEFGGVWSFTVRITHGLNKDAI